jgi:hypothetical protein
LDLGKAATLARKADLDNSYCQRQIAYVQPPNHWNGARIENREGFSNFSAVIRRNITNSLASDARMMRAPSAVRRLGNHRGIERLTHALFAKHSGIAA